MSEKDLNLFILFFLAGTWTLAFWCQYLYPLHSMLSFGVALAALMLMGDKKKSEGKMEEVTVPKETLE